MNAAAEIGRGLRAVVYQRADGRAVKVVADDTPEDWLREECRYMRAVEAAGGTVPLGASIEDFGGRIGLVCERVAGVELWGAIESEPHRAGEFGTALAELQLDLFRRPVSFEMPRQRDRLAAKMRIAAARHGFDIAQLLVWMPDGAELGMCHGDLHPRNLMVSDRGLVPVDWFDACLGVIAAEVARTSLLIFGSFGQPETASRTEHGLRRLHESYLDAISANADLDPAVIDRWTTIQLVARLAENLGGADVGEIGRRVSAW